MRTINLGMGTIYFGDRKTQICMGYRDTAYEAWKCCEIIRNGLSRINTGKFRIIYQQIGYSIELLLKALILWDDYSDNTKKFLKHINNRHNLKNLYNRLPEKKNILDENEQKQIFELSNYCADAGNFRYLKHIENRNWNFQFKLVHPNYFFNVIDKLYRVAKNSIYA